MSEVLSNDAHMSSVKTASGCPVSWRRQKSVTWPRP